MSRKPTKLRSFLTIILLGLLWVLGVVVRLLPARMWGPLATLFSWFAWPLLGTHRRRTINNLVNSGLSTTEAKQRGLACYRSCILVMFESLAMERLRERRGIRMTHDISSEAQQVIDCFKSGELSSLIIAGGHTGSWEVSGSESALLLAPHALVVSARLPREPRVARWLTQIRKKWGVELVLKDVFLRQMIQRQRAGNREAYCFFCDQHFARGASLPFLGRNACTVDMPALLSHKYQLPILMSDTTRIRPGEYRYRLTLLETKPFENLDKAEYIREVTAAINAHISAVVEEAPEQWTWAHRRWRDCCEAT